MSIGAKIINMSFNNKLGRFLTGPEAPAAAATIATVSNITKDGVNCYYYVTQSLHNKKIPEDKRKFVAGLDLANGILNVVTQTFVAIGVTKMTNKIFDNIIDPKYFSDDALKKLFSKIKTKQPYEIFKDNMSKYKTVAKSGLAVISALVATQIIAKRIIVPLIATPLASVFKRQFEKNEAKKSAGDTVVINKPANSDNQQTAQVETVKNNDTNNVKLPDCFKGFKK